MSKKTSQVLRKLSTPLLLLPAVVISVLFLLVGIIYALNASFIVDGNLSSEIYQGFFQTDIYMSTLRDTLLMSAGITALLIIISLPIAYYLAVRVKSDALKLVALLIMLIPFWTDWNIRMISWYPVLGKTGFINLLVIPVIHALGFQQIEYIKLLFNNQGVLITWIQSYILFMIAPIYLVMLRMDPRILKAASTLGANSLQTFYHITLKWSAPGIVIGSVFVFCMAMADYATPATIGGGLSTVGLIIWNIGAKTLNYSLAMASSIIVLAIIGIIIVVMLKIVDITRVMY